MSNQLNKVAAFVCSCADKQNAENIVGSLGESGIDVIFRHSALCTTGGCQFVRNQLSDLDVDGVVFAACTFPPYRRQWSQQLNAVGLNQHRMTVADIRGRSTSADKRRAAAAAVRRLRRFVRVPEIQDIPVAQTVLVVGAGPAAAQSALQAADLGCDVVLVSPTEELGLANSERLALYSESDTPAARRHVGQLFTSVRDHPGVDVLTGAEVTCVRGQVGNFELAVETGEGEDSILRGGAIIVATGMETQPPSMNFGLDVGAEVTTQLGFRRRLSSLADFEHEERPDGPCIVFFVDEDDEDSSLPFGAALQGAVMARRNMKCEVFVVCHQAKVALHGMDDLYRRAREAGVVFIKYSGQRPEVNRPEVPASFRTPDDPFYPLQITVPTRGSEIIDSSRGGQGVCQVNDDSLQIDCDCLVLAERLVPSAVTRRMGRMLSLRGSRSGYLQEDNVHLQRVLTNRRGVFAVGHSRRPCSLSDAMNDAQEAAALAVQLLGGGQMRVDWLSAHVNSEDCAFCLTCVRACPHEAAVPDYSEGAARIDIEACQGCGTCAGECPAGAIDLECYSTEALIASAAVPKEWEDD